MKKTLVLLTLAAAVASAYSQGTVSILTRDTGNGVNCVVQYGAGGPVTANTRPTPTNTIAGDGFAWSQYAKAGLYGGPNGSARDALTLLVPAVGFGQGNYKGYTDAGSGAERTVAGVPGGAQATFQLRAWDAGQAGVESYEAALDIANKTHKVYLGESALLNNITLGNYVPAGGSPTPMAPLTGLNGSTPITMLYVGVPEPSIIGLGILGAVAGLLVFRRRN